MTAPVDTAALRALYIKRKLSLQDSDQWGEAIDDQFPALLDELDRHREIEKATTEGRKISAWLQGKTAEDMVKQNGEIVRLREEVARLQAERTVTDAQVERAAEALAYVDGLVYCNCFDPLPEEMAERFAKDYWRVRARAALASRDLGEGT